MRRSVLKLAFIPAVVIGAIYQPFATAQQIPYPGVSISRERDADYPSPPADLKADPASTGMLLVDAEIVGLGPLKHNFSVTGVLLVNERDPLILARAGEFRRHPAVYLGKKSSLVLFDSLAPGSYAIAFIRGAGSGGPLFLPLTDVPIVEIKAGTVNYAGLLVIQLKFGHNPPTVELNYDPAREIAAWSSFTQYHTGLPWTDLASQRVNEVRASQNAAQPH